MSRFLSEQPRQVISKVNFNFQSSGMLGSLLSPLLTFVMDLRRQEFIHLIQKAVALHNNYGGDVVVTTCTHTHTHTTNLCMCTLVNNTCSVYNAYIPYSTKFSPDKNFAQRSCFVLAQKFRRLFFSPTARCSLGSSSR